MLTDLRDAPRLGSDIEALATSHMSSAGVAVETAKVQWTICVSGYRLMG